MIIRPIRWGPTFNQEHYFDSKDPCPVFDGKRWHIYGTGHMPSVDDRSILHVVSDSVFDMWEGVTSLVFDRKIGIFSAAPGTIFDEGKFHMFLHDSFLSTGSGVNYFSSEDGDSFNFVNISLSPLSSTDEAGLYDPHPAKIKGEKYLVYSGTPEAKHLGGKHYVSYPDLYLAKSESGSWAGPWVRKGKILSHEDVAWHHNQKNSESYEWGLEGPQLIELPNGLILLNATCFLPKGEYGHRQRVFFAFGEKPEGPYRSIGPIMEPSEEWWETGENGHAAGIIEGKELLLFYQARSGKGPDVNRNRWRYGIAIYNLWQLETFGRYVILKEKIKQYFNYRT